MTLRQFLMFLAVLALTSTCSRIDLDPLSPAPYYQWLEFSHWRFQSHMQWPMDGSRLFYSTASDLNVLNTPGLFAIDVDGSSTNVLVDPTVNRNSPDARGRGDAQMLHFDLSSDGSKIAYSTCRYDDGGESVLPYCKEGYEIVTADIDGKNVTRLTRNNHFDNFPMWSPDGASIAYISEPNPISVENLEEDIDPIGINPIDGIPYWSSRWGVLGRLLVRNLATGRLNNVTRSIGDRVAAHPPVWSPDGGRIAFVVYEDHKSSLEFLDGKTVRRRAVYTVKANGSDLRRISDAFSEPSWSPDGRRLALAVPVSESERGVHLYTFAADGSDPVLVTEVTKLVGRLEDLRPFWMGKVHWSPDGSRILFTKPRPWHRELVDDDRCWACVVTVNGGLVVEAAPFRTDSIVDHINRPPRIPDVLAWSPDGSRIAVRTRGQDLLYTVDRNGNDPRILVPAGEAGRSKAEVIASCSDGLVVPDPENNPGLVEDCRVLLRSRYILGGYVLNFWNPYTPMTQWGRPVWDNDADLRITSTEPGGTPARVESIVVNGTIEHNGKAYVYGQIPPELGSMSGLETLDMEDNFLRGGIPSELGNLTNLKRLYLGYNQLTGSIPPALGNLTNLLVLDLSHNNLSGPIPPEMAGLTQLRTLELGGNSVSGCVPAELRQIWVDRSGLPRCESTPNATP